MNAIKPHRFSALLAAQFLAFVLMGGFATAAVPDHPGTNSGYTPVETGVSDTGAAQIRIPIVVSPGTAGMQPKLSMNYSSQGGNGPLGIGFSLSGLSTISRVGRTVAQDGIKCGVKFDANDRFALDGQRLIAIHGADGADGTEYRLEFDPASRIRCYGTEGSGPQHWVVETRAGLKMEFGQNANSRIKPEGGTSALIWAVDRITDTLGNAIIFSYDESARQRGEVLVTKIDYTSNATAGLAANQSVVFEYEDRPDLRTNYVAGLAVKSLKRMTAVESLALANALTMRVRRYVLKYQQSEISGASLIDQIQETTTDGTQLPATTFVWEGIPAVDHKDNTRTTITANRASDRSPAPPSTNVDFDSDGRLDLLSWNAKVIDGHGGYTAFAYKPLTDPGVHTKVTGSTYPSDLRIVSSVTSRNGIDGDGLDTASTSSVGENTVNYRYEGAWNCPDGRGFMGFKALEAINEVSGIVTRTVFDDRPPYSGRSKHTEQRLLKAPPGGSSLLSESNTTWNIAETTHSTGYKTYFVTEASNTSKAYEVNRPAGSALVKTITRNGFSYDGYGNRLTSKTTTTDKDTFSEMVTSTYADALTPTQWFLGRLATSTVTRTGPNPAGTGTISLTRASSFAYHPTTGLLTQEVIEPNETTLRQQKEYTHDGFGNILTSTLTVSGEAPRITTTTYTPDGRFVATTTNALNHTESKTYDPLLGNVLTQTGPNDLTTTWEYDAIGRPTKETRPDGTATRSFYRRVTGSTVGAPPRAVHYVRVQSSGGAPKTVWYDLLDREIRADSIAFDGRTVSSHKVFNNRGEVTHASQPYFAGDTPLYSQMLYDAVGRETQQTEPGNRVTKTTYDGLTSTVERNYNPAVLTDFQKAVTVVNAMGWTVQSSQYLGNSAKTTTRKYDPYGNLRFVTDPANNTTELRYDVRGNKTWMSEPNSGTSVFTYNGFGELKTQTNAANQTVSLSYDKLGRVLTRTESEGVTTFEYDSATNGIGQLASETATGFERRYLYDHLCRPVSTVESHGFSSFAVSRSYDGYGRPDVMTYPTGLATRQIYTANGHLCEVQNATTGKLYWRALAVNARGQITKEVLGNGVVTNRTFDAESGLIEDITSTLGAVGDVQKLEFDFDLVGNLTARRDRRYSTTFSETFGYDTLNRLKTVITADAGPVSTNYDELGNITSRSDVGEFTYGAGTSGPHALTGVAGGVFSKACSYDVKGNRITDGATSLAYSSFNKVVRLFSGGGTLRFDYGPDRALYRQTSLLTEPNGATSQTVREHIGGLYERETTNEGLVRHNHYIAGGSGVVAIQTDECRSNTTIKRTRYVHKDHLGQLDVITDNAGTVVERQSFDAWGRKRLLEHDGSLSATVSPNPLELSKTGSLSLMIAGGEVYVYDALTGQSVSPATYIAAQHSPLESPPKTEAASGRQCINPKILNGGDLCKTEFSMQPNTEHFTSTGIQSATEAFISARIGPTGVVRIVDHSSGTLDFAVEISNVKGLVVRDADLWEHCQIRIIVGRGIEEKAPYHLIVCAKGGCAAGVRSTPPMSGKYKNLTTHPEDLREFTEAFAAEMLGMLKSPTKPNK